MRPTPRATPKGRAKQAKLRSIGSRVHVSKKSPQDYRARALNSNQVPRRATTVVDALCQASFPGTMLCLIIGKQRVAQAALPPTNGKGVVPLAQYVVILHSAMRRSGSEARRTDALRDTMGTRHRAAVGALADPIRFKLPTPIDYRFKITPPIAYCLADRRTRAGRPDRSASEGSGRPLCIFDRSEDVAKRVVEVDRLQ